MNSNKFQKIIPVDWHSHIWLPEHVSKWGLELDNKYSHNPSKGGSPECHFQAMEEANIQNYVVIGLQSEYLKLNVPNEFISAYVEESQGRAIGVAGIDPNSPTALDDIKKSYEELGLRGIKLAPPYQNFHPHSKKAFDIYKLASDFGMFMIFHQGAVTHKMGVLEVAQPVLIDKVAREFPETLIIIAHLGQPWYNEVIPLLRKHENVYADLSARCSRPNQLKGMLGLAQDYSVTDRLLWGSDFPTFSPLEHARGLLSIGDQDTKRVPDQIYKEVVEDILFNRPISLLEKSF